MRIMIRQLAPGMVQQMQSVCTDCNGEGKNGVINCLCRVVVVDVERTSSLFFFSRTSGEVISEKDRCKKCEGKKVAKEVKILEVHVDKGMKQNQKITFGGEADQAPGVEPGDIVIVLQEKEHEVG